jgi:hypothetical protein
LLFGIFTWLAVLVDFCVAVGDSLFIGFSVFDLPLFDEQPAVKVIEITTIGINLFFIYYSWFLYMQQIVGEAQQPKK